jgi:dienelactone hydrolase
VLTDFFGIWQNNQLLTDSFADAGYLAIMPDLFNGDYVTKDDYDAGKINVQEWLAKHGPEETVPIMDAIIKHIQEDLGIKKIAATGYCFGAKVGLAPNTPSISPFLLGRGHSCKQRSKY